jgi:glutamate-1-semialdehyde 2,1-aminomutase
MNASKSQAIWERASRVLPGGVNSPVRAFKAVGGHPPFIVRATGARLFDADDREFIDYVGSWGPAILGHAHPHVVEAVRDAAGRGLSFGAPTELEVRFAEALIERYPMIEKLRCVSSGTEATMSALRAARGATGRDLIVKFDGAYHGHADHLLVKAGSGAATFGAPDSAGVPRDMVRCTLTAGYNDVGALRRLFAERGKEIAAVIVEPVAGNMGCVPPVPGFLEAIVELCDEAGAVSIFDEVMTGCRLARGGASERYGLSPTMVCLGKVIGGGMPLAAYGGKSFIMDRIAPLGPVYQAGTLSGNPLAVSAGLATLELLTQDVYDALERRSARIESGLTEVAQLARAKVRVQRVGSMFTLFFHDGPVHSWQDASAADTTRFATFHRGLLERGVYWPPSQFEAAFLSAAHTDDDVERTIDAAKGALADVEA